MKRLLLTSVCSLALTSPAWAGVGLTGYFGAGPGYEGTVWAPSVDYRSKGLLVQIHALDLLAPLATGGDFYVNTGVDVTYVALKKKVGPEVEGVLMPGGGVYLNTLGDTHWYVGAEARMGAEMKQGAGFGMYVVPTLGVTNFVTGDVGLSYGGTIQVSAWFGK